MYIKPLKFKGSATSATTERLLELAGVDGARDLQAQSPFNDKTVPPEHADSSEDGQDEFNPKVQDVVDDNRTEGLVAMQSTLLALEQLETFIQHAASVTNPKYNQLGVEVETMKTTINSLLHGSSQPPVDADPAPGGGSNVAPFNF